VAEHTESTDFPTAFGVSGDFVMTPHCGASPGAAPDCTIDVAFKPMVVGSIPGLLAMASDAVGQPHYLTFSGTDFSPSAEPTTRTINVGSQLATH